MTTITYELKDLPDRFVKKVRVDPDTGCWEWIGARAGYRWNEGKGYASVWWEGRQQGGHRVAYKILVGPIPAGLTIDHTCRVTYCVNPAHMEPVTQRVNNERSTSPTAQNAVKTHCSKAGHPLDGENLYIRPDGLGYRDCLICRRERTAASRQRRRVVAA